MQALALVMLAIGAARAAWGMGLRPMLGLTRPTYPMARGRASLGRLSLASRGLHVTPAPGGRVVKRSNDPRPLTYAKACPYSCLKDKRAGGAPALATGNGAGGDSVETPCVLEELTPAFPVLSCLWGMGLRPMLGLSRPTYPMARGGALLGRLPSFASRSLLPFCLSGHPRTSAACTRCAASGLARPYSSLINTLAAGALPCP